MSEFWNASGNRNTDASQQRIAQLEAALEGPLPLRVLSLATSGTFDPAARLVRYVGANAADVITLPTANAQGAGTGQLVVLVNTSAVAISVVPSGADTLNGAQTAYALAATSAVVFESDSQGAWWAALVPDATGRLLRSTVLTGTTLAVFAGTKSYRVRLWGGGGGGGGVISAIAAAGGGGAGSYAERVGNPIAASYTFALGAGGTGGSTAGGDGGNGGSSIFSAGGVTVTAPGGTGGAGDAAGTAGATSRGLRGGPGGALATNGTTNGGGAPGQPSVMVRINFADIMAISGAGGSSSIGGGGLGHARPFTTTAAGNAAIGPAAGGGGAIDDGTAARAGGAGGAGYGILEEFA